MPAASYREGPDGHSSRKQNSKRRRAKCSPSFVSGRVIGHGDILPRCIPECSAMALHRAVPAARSSRASTLSFVLLTWRHSLSSAFGAVFFAGRAAVVWCGANPSVRPWQDLRECALGRLVVAIFSRDAFSGVLPRQDSAAVCSRASIRGRFCAPCIPKVASDGRIASSWQDSRAMHPKTGSLWQDMRAMHPKCPANRRRRIHRAKILPGRGTFRCTGPSNHARRADLAVRRSAKPPERPQPRCRRTARAARARSPGPRNTARRQRPRRLLGSKYRRQLPCRRHRSLLTPASSLSPGEQLCHCRQRHLWRQHPRRHRPADSPTYARPKGGLSSLLAAPVFCALGRCDRLINARRSPFYAIISLWLRKNRHPSGKTQALPIQWVGCSRGHVPYRTINKEKRLRWQLLHIALSARKRRKW